MFISSNNEYVNNRAIYGGAIYTNVSPRTYLVNDRLFSNGALQVGAIPVPVGAPPLDPLSPTLEGGAIFVDDNSVIDAANLLLVGNVAQDAGGAIYWKPRNSQNAPPDRGITIKNCTFARNQLSTSASLAGRDIHLGPGRGLQDDMTNFLNFAEIDNCITSLEGDGSQSSVTPIFREPFVAGQGPLSGINNPLQLYIRNCNTNTTALANMAQVNLILSSNIQANPLFRNPALGNYRLRPNSPSVNTGSQLLLPPDAADINDDGLTSSQQLPLDLDEIDRVQGAQVDMGPYEQAGL